MTTRWSLIIEDNGVGFDPARRTRIGAGFGLTGMQERAALVGAQLQIESAAGEGTTMLRPDADAVGRRTLRQS